MTTLSRITIVLAVVVSVCSLVAEAPIGSLLADVSIAGSHRRVHGVVRNHPITGFGGVGGSITNHVCTLYLPDTGFTWAGLADTARSNNLAFADERIWSFWFHTSSGSLFATISTNRYQPGLSDSAKVLEMEFHRFTNSAHYRIGWPQYEVRMRVLLGSNAILDPTYHFAQFVKKPPRLCEVSVEGTNAVTLFEYRTLGQNSILAKIGFDRNMHPVWATTNGVYIGSIPTNCVFFSDLASNRVVTRVVY